MTGLSKVDSTVGVITVSLAGVTAKFTNTDLQHFGNTLLALAPLILILFLLWRIVKLDKAGRTCERRCSELQTSQTKLHEQVINQLLIHPANHQVKHTEEVKESQHG